MSLIDRLPREPFFLFSTVPAAIVICTAAAPFPLMWLEYSWPELRAWLPELSAGMARSLLTVIATGAMTALSLTYSLTLLVFTLAAGSIGPRLLKRFISDKVSQVTAGALGGAFLYALVTLLFVGSDDAPRLAVLFAIVLAVHAVLQLVFFVRHVARNVSIDDEIAAISARLTAALTDYRDRFAALADLPAENAFEFEIVAKQSGYVGKIDYDALVALAREADAVIRLERGPGKYVGEDEAIVSASRRLDDAVCDRIRAAMQIDMARADAASIEFSIHLLIEIALRALSPGVNDIYTAVAVSDAISSALCDIVGDEKKASGLTDADGAPRLIAHGLVVKDLVGQSFHPLRRSGAASILMSQALARAFRRLHAAGDDHAKSVIMNHARLLIRQLEHADHLETDIESVVEFLSPEMRNDVAETH